MVQGGCCCAWHCTHRVCTELFPTYRFEFKRIIEEDCMRMEIFLLLKHTHLEVSVSGSCCFFHFTQGTKKCSLPHAHKTPTRWAISGLLMYPDAAPFCMLHTYLILVFVIFGSVFMGLRKVFCKKRRILPSLVPVNRFHFTGNWKSILLESIILMAMGRCVRMFACVCVF